MATRRSGWRDLTLGIASVLVWCGISLIGRDGAQFYTLHNIVGLSNHNNSSNAVEWEASPPIAVGPTSLTAVLGGVLLFSAEGNGLVGTIRSAENHSVFWLDAIDEITKVEVREPTLAINAPCWNRAGQCTYIADANGCAIVERDDFTKVLNVLLGGTCDASVNPAGQTRQTVRFGSISGIGFQPGFGMVIGTCSPTQHGLFQVRPDEQVVPVVGGGPPGFFGDGGAAVNGLINCPSGIFADGDLPVLRESAAPAAASGTFLFADQNNHRIRKFTIGGTIDTVAGCGSAISSTCKAPATGDNGAATQARLSFPACVSAGSDGYYVCDQSQNRIRRVTWDTGIITTVAGNGSSVLGVPGAPATTTAVSIPVGVAQLANGDLYIAESGSARISMIHAGQYFPVVGNSTTQVEYYFNGDNRPGLDTSLAQVAQVITVGAGPSDTTPIIFTEFNSQRVRKWDPVTDRVTTVAGNGRYAPLFQSGAALGDGGPAAQAFLANPNGLARTSDGSIYVLETTGCRMRRIDPLGIITTVIGGDGTCSFADGPVASARLYIPQGMAADASDNLYWADQMGRVRMLDAARTTVTTVAGNGSAGFSGDGGPAVNATLTTPLDVAVDSVARKLYIADTFNHRIRVVDLAAVPPTISTLAGNGTKGFSGDGGPALAASFDQPAGVEVVDGVLLVGDYGNNAVRRVAPLSGGAPLVTTVAGLGPTKPGRLGRNGPAAAARTFSPQGLAATSDGIVYVAELNGHRVARLVPSAAPSGPPGAPGTPTASVNGNVVTFNWTAPSLGAAPFTYTLLARTVAGGPIVATLPVGAATSYTVTAPNGTFIVSIKAANAEGAGPESAPVTFSAPAVPPAPGAPGSFSAAVNGTTANFTWTPPSTGGAPASYTMIASLSPGGPVIATLPIAANSDQPIDDDVAAAVTSYSVPNVPPGTYYVKLFAANAGGTGPASNEVTVTVAAPAAPNAPTLKAPSVSGRTVTLTWVPAGTGGSATGYVVSASLTAGGVVIATLPTMAPTLTVTNVPPGTYFVKVRATNAVGTSGASNEVTVIVN